MCFIHCQPRCTIARYDSPIDCLWDTIEPAGLNQLPHSYQQESFQSYPWMTMFSQGQLSYNPHWSTDASTTTPSPTQTGLDVTGTMSSTYGIQSYNSYQSMQMNRSTSLQQLGSPEPVGQYWRATSSGSSPTQNSSPVLGQMYPLVQHVIHHNDTGTVNERHSFLTELHRFLPTYSNIWNALRQW